MTGSQPPPPVRIVVVTHNSEAVLGGLLDSLEAGARGVDSELVIVDNGSTDGTVELVRERAPWATLIESGANPGYAAAVNRGLAAGDRASDVLLLNPDARLGEDAAARLQARLREAVDRAGEEEAETESEMEVGLVAPRLEDANGALLPSLRHQPTVPRALAETVLGVRAAGRWGLGETVLDPARYDAPTTADWASGAALMISRDCLEACGDWDESFFLYSEDADYSLRARDGGFATCLAPDATAIHLGGASRSDPALWSLLALNKVALHRKRHGPVRALAFRAVSLLRELRFAATGNRPSRAAARALLSGRRSSR